MGWSTGPTGLNTGYILYEIDCMTVCALCHMQYVC